MRKEKLLQKILRSSENVKFNDLVNLIQGFEFRLIRVNGSHHIFSHKEINELINIQNVNGEAKPYQVKQFLKLIEKYDLKLRK